MNIILAATLSLTLCSAATISAQAPTFRAFGSGCVGTFGAPELTNVAGSLPMIGSRFSTELRWVPNGTVAVGALGFSNTTLASSGAALPLALDVYGLSGCFLYTDIGAQVPLAIVGDRADWDIDLPRWASLVGLTFYQQVAVLETTPWGTRWLTSNATECVIGDLPDLEFTSSAIGLSVSSVNAGSSLSVSSFTIKNDSAVSAGYSSMNYYLSTNSVISTADTLLLGTRQLGMAPNQSRFIYAQGVTVPATTPGGEYWIGVLLDSYDELDERQEWPNYKSQRITVVGQKPDLVVSSAPQTNLTQMQAGQDVTFGPISIKNQGNQTSPGSTATIYLARYLNAITSGVALESFAVGTIAQGATLNMGSRTVTIPPGTSPNTYWLAVVLDDDGDVHESDETNNIAVDFITVHLQPVDLVITSGTIGLPDVIIRPLPWISFPIPMGNFTVKNQGGIASGPFHVGYYYNNVSGNMTPGLQRLAELSHPGLAPGQSYTFPARVVYLPAGKGPHNPWFGVLVDNREVVNESDETNNSTSKQTYIW